MTDINELKRIIKESGKTMVAISKQSGIERVTLYNRLSGKSEFNVSEIVGLCKALDLSVGDRNRIFFKKQVELNATEVK